jgi:enterochelin esterase-like enzyme
MRSITGIILLQLMLFISAPVARAGGTVTDQRFFSKAMNKEMACRVYLPAAYQPENPGKRFPVIYFLHGATLGYTSYDMIYPIIDNLIAFGLIKPVIIVMPDGLAPPYNGSFYTNSALYGNFEDYVSQDLIAFTDSAFHTYGIKSKRAIMGASMGGYGALKIAFRYPELFTGVAGHSGPVNTNMMDSFIPALILEDGGQPPYRWSPGSGKSLTNLTFSMAGAFSPNLNAPYLVDFPLDSAAVPIASVMNRWKSENVCEIARIEHPSSDLSIWFDCGTADEYDLNLQNRALADTLAKYGISGLYEEYAGTHTSGLPIRVTLSLTRFDKLFTSTGEADPIRADTEQWTVFPSPAFSVLNVRPAESIQPDSESHFLLLDTSGRVVFSRNFSGAGSFDISGLGSGNYFYLLRYGNRSQTGRTAIIHE